MSQIVESLDAADAAELRGPPEPAAGWYALGLSRELAPGTVWARSLHDRELVVARTEAGRLVAFDAFCPHLGAHIGHGGTVVGENIRCPFHGFLYDPEGRCTATGYGRAIPSGLTLGRWPVEEVGGVILAWSSPSGQAPGWHVPALDMRGWTPWKVTRHLVRGHPQETTENSVDLGHFAAVHHYSQVSLTNSLQTSGAHLTIGYRMTRRSRWAGVRWPAVSTAYDIDVWGLGWSRVEVTVVRPKLRMRLLVLASHVGPESVELRLAVSMPWRRAAAAIGPEPLTRLPLALMAAVVVPTLSRAYEGDVGQDFSIWQNKRYLTRPALAAGDGPIVPYRRWARQFYAPTAAAARAPLHLGVRVAPGDPDRRSAPVGR